MKQKNAFQTAFFPSIRIRNVFEIQHKQIPKQRRGGRAEQHPRADFGNFAQGALLPAAEEAVDNQRGKCEKEKIRKSLPIISGSGKPSKKYGSCAADEGQTRQAACPTVSKSHAVCDIITLFAAFVGTGYESKCLGGHCNAPKNSV
ncbi:hypothetical protein NEIPOLOT_01846 [Neisseria polysaccharea ATCC 43768]|nr:hypothetical protein NEIPOLOT_01846 [Neisseria polysaccharea ATCC 43768]